MPLSLIYVTFGSNENAHEVAKDIIESGLASCVNIFPPMQSIYKWNDEIREEPEIAAIFKTRTELFDKLRERIKLLHSYDTPCIIAVPIENADEAFANWVIKQTSGAV